MLRCVFWVASVLCLRFTFSNPDDGLPPSNLAFQFTAQLYNVRIPENSVAKTYATQTPGAPRMGMAVAPNTFTDIRYRIVEGDKDRFFKAEHRLVGDFCFLFIRIKTGNNDVLNRERKDKYYLQVRATASNKEGNQKVQYTSEATVVVTVLDTNDNSPLFYPTEYNATIAEDTPIYQSILRVIAGDADLGRNGEIYYSFAEETDQFAIHPVTGVVTLTRPLRFSEGIYELKVHAQDRGLQSTPSFSVARVRIRVKKMNFYAPEIRIRRHPSIVENSNADIYAIVNVSDRDSGIHGEIDKLEIVDGDPDGHFRIRPAKQPGEYNIEVLKLLDREKTPRGYDLKLRAVDKGIPPRETYKSVPVELTDLNDNAPVFNQEIYDVKVQESAPINTPLIRLKVTDSDEGKNAQVSLEIVGGNEGGEFHINTETGMLYTAVHLDAESKQFYSLTVSAIDQGNFGTRKQSSAKVKIYVEDVNDNDPIFDKAKMTVWIDENMPAGTSVTTVHAKDKDRGENAYISYLIANLKKVPFEIDHFSGLIKTTQLLDYESMRREYVLRIRASDWGQPYRRQTEMEVTVKVRDVNDNRPQFEKIDCKGNLPRHTPIGTEIITLSAIDFDAGNIISYRIVSGNEDICFSIDSTSGTITVSCELGDVKVNERELNVTATDNTHFADIATIKFNLVNTRRNVYNGGKHLTDDTGMFDCRDTGVARRLTEVLAEAEKNNGPLDKEDLPMMPTRYGQNVHSPEFIDFPVEIRVNESVAIGSVLVKLKARDRDLGYNGELVYGITSGDSRSQFAVDMKTGELKVIGYLDREREYEYFLNVTVYDLGKPQQSSSRILPITVLDVNDNAPKFEKALASFRVTENALNGTSIFTASATDLDVGDNAKVTYSLATDTKDFVVDKVTGVLSGVIKTTAILDIETKDHYWLTVFAQDHGVVPLFSSVEIYIEVINENDNAPLSERPVYYPIIQEDSPAGTIVLQIKATDRDRDPGQEIFYNITTGNPEGFFTINSTTGVITTTARKLNRETQDEHILEVTITDNGEPPLSSTTRVVIKVDDINDNAPEFEQAFYSVTIPATGDYDRAMFQVLAFDRDIGQNAQINYQIKSGKGRLKFKIDHTTGMIYAQKGFEPGQEYELNIKATDGGIHPKSNTCKVSVKIVAVPKTSKHPPVVKQPSPVKLTEGDQIGFLVSLIQGTDQDNDTLWYDIVDGDERRDFYIGRDMGNILLAHKLDHELQNEYVLNISVTDTVHTIYTQLNVTVIDINDHRPEFTESLYKVEISEAVPVDTEIFRLEATDKDENDKLIFSFYSAENVLSLKTFKLDSITGIITLATNLDRETLSEHILTIMVRDAGTPAKKNLARLHVIVHDHNDHAPHFSDKILVGKVYETASVGSVVLKALAVDHDKGENAVITYSIVSGNVGNVFSIDPDLGTISIARELDLTSASEYTLHIRASDHGQPPLWSTVPAHISLSMADNAPPRFINKEIAAEIYEDQPLGSYVAHLDVRSTSSLQFEILTGNSDDSFIISPSTGVITTQKHLDYETNKFYNLSVIAINMASVSATCNVIIHILDKNDNVPQFLQFQYYGIISEAAPVASLVLTNNSEPLVIKAFDADSERNALLHFEIMEILPRRYFQIDSNTGAIRSIRLLDHETMPFFRFYVQVSDLGKPRLFSDTTARVDIQVTDVNDCPPIFSSPVYNVTILLPSYKNVAIIQLNATDPDSSDGAFLKYDIIEGNKLGVFQIDSRSGVVTLVNPDELKSSASYKLHVRVSDGKFSNVAKVYIRVEKSDNSSLIFQKPFYEGNIVENSTKITIVCVVNVLGTALNQHVEFRILNPTDMFTIGLTSGVIRTTGRKFDREVQDKYQLIVEARTDVKWKHERSKPRVAHVIVNITVLDINDNCPMFVNLPYYAVVSVDDEKGSVITKVHAIDLDSSENGEVRYELIKGQGELFKVQRESGDIEIRQNLEGHNKEYDLLIAAYDKGITPCRTDVTVHIKVIDRSMPVFKKQFYSETVPENVELHSPLSISIEAESPLSRKLIYSIVRGNELEEFALDFNTAPDSNNGPCVISVIDELDYEQTPQYELLIRATDSVSGVYAEVPVSIILSDVNDCPPEFTQESYNISVSEAAQFGTHVLTVVAMDNDTGINKQIVYSIQKEKSNNATDYFYIDEEGKIYLKQGLDHEIASGHHFIVKASDKGVPSLSSTAHVWINVLDMNDNAPKFEFSSYSCGVSVSAKRDQFVTIVKASDLDEIDQNNLKYSIVSGNEQQTFSMNPSTGIISLVNLANFGNQQMMLLNISVSDGVYTSFARLKVELIPANLHPPKFTDVILDVTVPENRMPGMIAATVNATDDDFGDFGTVSYSIHSDLLNEIFSIDKNSGRIVTKAKLDRETKKLYEIPVMATDGGGLNDFLTVRVRVTDENDNSPRFLLKEYKISIPSNQTTGVTFAKIRATDDDEGLAAQLEYSIYERKSSEVASIFGINPATGELSLIRSVYSWVGEVFQFFIRATDKGKPERHSDVPVNILIMGPTDFPPVFERKENKFFLSENSPTGTVITKLKILSNVSNVNFEIVSDSEENPQFTVDSQGQVSLARPLNFESQPVHLIAVLALTDSSPPLTALAEVVLQVQDENDHPPQFESNIYYLNLGENVAEGTSILRVIAHDADQGSNGEVRYSFSSENSEIINYFALDTHTGWISTLVKLDKETRAEYKFYIIGTDNGTPKHSARTTVLIKVKDYNDSPTVFKEPHYEASVKEDALPGTVLLTLTTTDLDSNLTTPVEFYIISGDLGTQFQIRQTGELFVAKSLDREKVSSYSLDILVTDGLFIDTTKVDVQILDANDNPPYCLKYRYRQVLSEGILPGSFVLTILANDIDGPEHSKLKYVLSGDGSESFLLDQNSGDLKTIMHLDRETQSKYLLTAHVHDKEHIEWECSSQIELVVSDLNDNAPVFSLPYYSVALPEDVEIGTLVTKIHATDADIGINRKIKYSFIDSFNDHFIMAHDSGIVTLAKPLDREIRAMYNLTVRAVDQGTPPLSSVASLIVNVQDINDNPPEFENKYYFASVPEIDAVGTEIVRVQATSKDIGANADVYYSIIGGNEHKKFSINNKTGVIIIADMLDFEKAKDYFLTIQAIDGGTPPLSNVATVNITVTDCNDNAPIFNSVSYSALIKEDAHVGDKIVQIIATDLDSNENGEITYSINDGDQLNQFSIDPKTGYVSVAGPLDREAISSYVLEILAKDSGLPVLSRQTTLNIEISDANDNPPTFSQANYTAIIQENKPIGHSILQFKVTDDDVPPNTVPYTFDIRVGNEGNYFRLDQDGILRTASKFNHKIRNNYLLQVRVFDNGSPPLYSDTWVLVKVIEESQYPPIIHPLDININSYLDEYPGGIIGKVYANDQDQYDTLTYTLYPTVGVAYPTHELFQINRTDGTLTALPRLDVGEYRLNVSVTDGKFFTFTIVKINVEILTEIMLENSVGIRFRDVSPEAFILSHKKGFMKAIKNAMDCKLKDIIIISVQSSNNDDFLRTKRYIHNDLDVLFTVRKPDQSLYSSETIRKALNDNLEELEESTKLVVEEIIRPKCNNKYCMYGICQDHFVLDVSSIQPVSTDVTSFVSPMHRQKLDCLCKEGFGGERCDTIVNECAREPCPIFKICVPDASQTGYSCQCPEGFAGPSCDVDISKCHNQNCYIARNPISFSGKSYSQYRIINKKSIEDQLSLSLRVKTVQPTGNLMYASGKVDYNILEVVNGVVQYRFDLGSGEGIVRVANAYISDGNWHEIKLERDRNNAKITIDGNHVAQGSAPGISDILNLQSDEMYLGAEVHQHPSILGFEDVQKGFTGCMDDIRISRVSVPLHKSGENSVVVLKRFANVEFSCDTNSMLVPPGPCGSQPCLNGGTCREIKGGFECECHNRFTGTLCELDTDPCASAPCLYGGKCTSTIAGDFVCECVLRLSGKRCEYGRYCSPNPCKHGGVCEEGDDGPLCKCRSYSGEFCEYDLNECESSPCQNGGTCINEIGSFHCICPSNVTGIYCANSIFNSPISPNFFLNITWNQLLYFGLAISALLMLAIIICSICCCRMRQAKKRRSHNNENIKVLNSTHHNRSHELSEMKRGSKLSNLEVNHREIPICTARPVSYTPSSQNEAIYNNNAIMRNNLDTLRSYGSAGDELENPAPDYGKNLNRSTPQGCISNHYDSEKAKWTEMQLAGLNEKPKIKNDYKVSSPVNCDLPNRLYGGRGHNTMTANVRPGVGSLNDEDQRNVGSYHWDCSDWARHSQTLPNITEVPGSEIPDSSSFHSNESNESRSTNHNYTHYNQNRPGGILPLNEVDIEFEENSNQEQNALNSLSGDGSSEHDYRFATAESYIRHPNSYLPPHSYNIPSEAEVESLQSPGSDDVEPYGFPSKRNNRRKHTDDDDMASVITTLDERHSLLGGCYASNSDLSTNLCEIEDSECEAEHKPLNYMSNSIHQTDV
ncbi:hypothetical protein ABEB36_013210 [Hypothenemus hampei]|uniref:Fat-like cadherin-related tumor suppressor homolog n=1 Tax=Hypothenemus hampei TaxID=57062 RepID=A0ABD1E9X4_HYPHA